MSELFSFDLGFAGWCVVVIQLMFSIPFALSISSSRSWQDAQIRPWYHWMPLLIPLVLLICLAAPQGNDWDNQEADETFMEVATALFPWMLLMALCFHLLSRFVLTPKYK